MMRHGAAMLAIAANLAACSTAPAGSISEPIPAATARPQTDITTCQGAPYLRLTGQDATALERELILREVRLIRPGQPSDASFRPQRLTFSIDAQNRIDRVYCG